MSSSGIRGIRRKKSSLGEVKVAVVGAAGVGKSGQCTFRYAYKFIFHILTLSIDGSVH